MFDIKYSLTQLPDKPGVYLHKDKFGEIIYIGKARSLQNRVRQYFQSQKNKDAKVRKMVSQISEFEYIVTETEVEALILENTLIKKHMPKYNILLRDDKTYPYIKITYYEKFPRLMKTRTLLNDGSKYFGPYADVKSANTIIDLLNDIFKLKRCTDVEFNKGHKECLHYHINRCKGPCRGEVDSDEYRKSIDTIIDFLSGRDREVINYIKKRMKEAADSLQFEIAAEYRDYLLAAESVVEKQIVDLMSSGNMDIVVGEGSHIIVSFVRQGRLTGKESHHLDLNFYDPDFEEAPENLVSAFIKQHYMNAMIPKEILVEKDFFDLPIVEEWLSSKKGSKVKIHVAKRGDKRALVRQARQDIDIKLEMLDKIAENKKDKSEKASDSLKKIICPEGKNSQDRLLRLEAYDISNIGGIDAVGAMVVFSGIVPLKKNYRKFKIKSLEGQDDYASMQEVVYRRLKRGLDRSKGFDLFPDALLIDGGRGHVNSVEQVVCALKLNIPVLGMVKDDRHRTKALIYEDVEYDLKKYPELYYLIANIQEEVHRFAIDYHRGLRGKKYNISELDEIDGIGEKRKAALFRYFKTLEAIKSADLGELKDAPLMTAKSAQAVHNYFNKENKG